MNVTVRARNSQMAEGEWIEVLLTLEMVGRVKGVKVDDRQIITSKDDEKTFDVTFESLGSGSCMVFDFKDGVIKTYGDQHFCTEWMPAADYDQEYDIGSPMIVKHTY